MPRTFLPLLLRRAATRARAVRLVARLALVGAPVALFVPASPLAAQATSGADILVLLAGSDTLAVERLQRTATRLEAELLVKPANARFTYTVEVDASAAATRLVNAFRQGTADRASAPAQSAEARFTGDSVFVDVSGGGRGATQRFGTRRGAVPFLNPSFALVELIIRRARVMGGDSVEVPVWNLQGGTTTAARVVRLGADSVVVYLGAVPARLAVGADGEILGGGVPSQGLRVVRVRGGGSAVMAVEPPDYSAPAGAPYTAEDVRVPVPAGHVLAGTLTLPRERRGRIPAVVTISGSGPQDRDEAIPGLRGFRPFRQVADTLSRHGIAVLRLDDRGTGSSTGNHATATSADFAVDVRAAVAWLRARPEIDPARVALVGHSEGGLIAPMVAAEDPSLRAIVLMAGPAQTGRQILRFQLGNAVRRDTSLSGVRRDSALAAVDATIDSLGRAQPWIRFFLDYDPLATARRVRVPTLILQGATDLQVTAEQAESLERVMRAAGNRQVTRHTVPEANHLFLQDANGSPAGYGALPTRHVRPDVLALLLQWLQRALS
jgi:dienelactone hydrolase